MLVVDGTEVAVVEVAGTRRARARGLLGRSGVEGALWLPGVRSVHTLGMRFAVDVAWIDDRGTVLRTTTLPPGRVTGLVRRSVGVLEAETPAFERWGLSAGSRVRGPHWADDDAPGLPPRRPGPGGDPDRQPR